MKNIKILDWLKTILARMLGNSSAEAAVSTEMLSYIALWDHMLKGRPYWLQKGKNDKEEKSSLNLPAAIVKELARLVTIEMKSEISGSPRADYLNEQYQRILYAIPVQTEFACAKGGLVFKPYISDGNIGIDFIQADNFYPITFDGSGNMTGVIFAQQQIMSGSIYTRLEYHELQSEGHYRIANKAFVSKTEAILGREIALSDVPQWADIVPEVILESIDRPLFSYFKMPFANKIDMSSPIGVSAYAQAVNLIRDADIQYNQLLWEFKSGNRKIFADITAFEPKIDGKLNTESLDNRIFVGLDLGPNPDAKAFLDHFSPDFREQSILNGLNAILRKIEFNCGLAYGTLSDVQQVDKTATEVKASKQRSYATITDIQKSLQAALEQLIYAMDVLATLYKLAPAGTYKTSFEWDDSIVTDTDVEFARRMQMVGTIISPAELRSWYFGETLEQAEKNLPNIQQTIEE